jgi:hypothetical protein
MSNIIEFVAPTTVPLRLVTLLAAVLDIPLQDIVDVLP